MLYLWVVWVTSAGVSESKPGVKGGSWEYSEGMSVLGMVLGISGITKVYCIWVYTKEQNPHSKFTKCKATLIFILFVAQDYLQNMQLFPTTTGFVWKSFECDNTNKNIMFNAIHIFSMCKKHTNLTELRYYAFCLAFVFQFKAKIKLNCIFLCF